MQVFSGFPGSLNINHMKILLLFLFLAFGMNVHEQVAVSTYCSSPDNSAMPDLKSTGKGMLIPRMNAAQRDAIVSLLLSGLFNNLLNDIS